MYFTTFAYHNYINYVIGFAKYMILYDLVNFWKFG